MKHKSLTDSQSDFDASDFSVSADQFSASFIPSSQPTSVAATASSVAFSATIPSDATPGSTSNAITPTSGTSVSITTGGITINLLFDAAAMAAPASFRAGVEQGAALLASAITDKITVNLTIDYNEGAVPSGVARGFAGQVVDLSYSQVRNNLISHAAPGDTTFNALPQETSVSGLDPDNTIQPMEQFNHVWVYSPQAKIWGLLGANDPTTNDGTAVFSTNIDPNKLASVALDGLTQALGRVPVLAQIPGGLPPDVFDLFRFSSVGVRLFQSPDGAPAHPASFSVDGVAGLASYDEGFDPSDFRNGTTPNPFDPFTATPSGSTILTALDLQQMTALGFHMSSAISATTIENFGATRLDQIGLYYYLDDVNGITEGGPSLKYNGAPVYQGEFVSAVPIGAEQFLDADGESHYRVVWNTVATDQFQVWITDIHGNPTSVQAYAGEDPTFETLELTFKQDLNGDGVIGIPPIVIESSGVTKLVLLGNTYFLDPVSGGQGPALNLSGGPSVAGWSAIGAEQTAGGYEVAWKAAGADQYTVWMTDRNGNYLSTSINAVSGASLALELAETSFHQDLNGDGLVGPPNIEAFGSTRLDQFGSNYFLDAVSGEVGPSLKWQGAAVTVGQFGSWTPLAAEQTASGYEVAWKVVGADEYQVWTTDNNGNFVSTDGALTGASTTLEAAEVRFHQDLNGDGIIGVPPTTIEAFGATKLDLAGATYSLDPVGGGHGPTLDFQGGAVIPGEFGSWTPIGAEQTASGYEVAWKVPGADQYILWTMDGNGNYVTQSGTLTGASIVLEAAEVSLHQDLNGDGRIGVAPTTIEGFGSTKLDLAGATYSLDPVSGGQGLVLKYQGAAVTPGQFGSWTAIGAEHTASGYEVAWKVDGADQYIIWNTDSSGNYVNQGGAVTGASFALETAETSFHQDLNGDGTIGLPNIESFGATKLDLVGHTYSLDPVTGGQGPTLQYQGAAVTPGQFGTLAPIGAEQTATGYEIAWKDATGAYSLWNADNHVNYISTVLDHVAGTNTNLEMQESFFQQDLNGDGVIGVPPTPPSGPDGGPVQSPPASGPGGDSFVFQPNLGTNSTMAPASLSASSDLGGPSSGALPAPTETTMASDMLIQQVSDSHDPSSSQDALHHLADMHMAVFIH